VSESGPVGVGLIGAGNISDAYLSNLIKFPDVRVLFVADLDLEKAASQAKKYQILKHGSVADLLADPEIELVINLTVPAAHVKIGLQAIAAGKHIWAEKPFAIDRTGGDQLSTAASSANLKLSVAPDTFLGAGLQTAFRAIKTGEIGKPLSALALFQVEGPESWHPNPEFFYQHGGGPLLDMGPYYLTALAKIFGTAVKVTATSAKSRSERDFGAGPNRGGKFAVTIPTQFSALIEYAGGGSALIILSFDSTINRAGFLEVTGETGVAVLPDPNNFNGETVIHKTDGVKITLPAIGLTYGRGTGALDLAQSIRLNRNEQVPGELAFHVFDLMLSIQESAKNGQSVYLKSTFNTPAELPIEWDPVVKTLF